MKIEVLGDGCSRSDKFCENVLRAVKESGKEADIIRRDMDPQIFAYYGVRSLPGLVIDGVLKVSGKISRVEKIRDWMK